MSRSAPSRRFAAPRAAALLLGVAAIVLAGCAGPGAVRPLVSNARLLVISDIDDTIKDTHVTVSRSTHLKNPLLLVDFLQPWRPVQGMPALYRDWQRQGAVFAYVSGGPRAYESRLEKFLAASGFPAGPIFLNPHFPISTREHKDRSMARLLESCLSARVILVGDSGEHDPAIFAKLLEGHPERIAGIFIRAVTTDAASTVSLLDRGTSRGKWIVFAKPSDISERKIMFPEKRRSHTRALRP